MNIQEYALMDLKGIKVAIGWKSPLRVVKGLSLHGLQTVNKESLGQDEPLLDDFMAARDYKSFECFCKKYGLIMLQDLISGVTVNRTGVKGATITFDGRESVVSRAELAELWTAVHGRVKVLQRDIVELQHEQENDDKAFTKHLNKGMARVRVKAYRDSGGNGYSLVLRGPDIKQALYLSITLAGVPLAQCEGCPGVFLQTRPDKKYCSSECQKNAHKRNSGEVTRRKNQARARFYRLRDKDPEAARVIESDVLASLREAHTPTAVRKIEKKYGLERQSPGRKAAKKGEAGHGGTRSQA
jgi:hypothetical protein